ncbi:MAG: hypothetical protein H6625_02040 [Bdellovibrionaceae bacterium]|nr:hypothetical protein [Pseudobdellovibrionaceae bacterium]
MLKRSIFLYIFIISFSLTNCTNILDEFAKKDTDEALLFEAKKNMNDGSWDLAIANFAKMSTAFLAERDVKLQHAKAYAGRCGLDLLQLFEDLSSNLSTGRLYALLMSAFTGATSSNADDCATAEDLLLSISTSASSRSSEENSTLAFISFAKMGAIFAAFSDETTSDGTVDGDFDACQDNTSPGVPEAYVREVGIGLAIASTSLTAAISSGGLTGADELTSATSACTALEALGAQFNFCSQTDPSALTADQVKAIRWTMMDNQSIGLGGANNCDLSGVSCPINCAP